MQKTIKIIAAASMLAAIFSACTVKDDLGSTGTTSSFEVKLTDDPAAFTRVNIEIRSVLVNLTDDISNNWITLNTNAGVYDLLTLQNGKDTLLAKGTLSGQTVKQIQFILGTNNTVDVGNLTYPLTIPLGADKGLHINLNKDLVSKVETVLIDFDANASIQLEPNGSYTLRPVLTVRVK